MRDKDLMRVYSLVKWHKEGKRADPIRGMKAAWSLVKYAAWSMPLLMQAGYITTDKPKTVPGGDKKD